MNAVLCTNVVYPVYTRGQYIRHYTPGRWWDCVYTWDSGFIGMGLAQTSLRNAFDCLNTYLMPPDSVDAAFLHHGSMVPTQFYLYRMGSCDHGRAAGLQTAATDLLLWGIIVPSTRIIEIIPGTQQAAVQVGGSGAAFLPGEEAVVQL